MYNAEGIYIQVHTGTFDSIGRSSASIGLKYFMPHRVLQAERRDILHP